MAKHTPNFTTEIPSMIMTPDHVSRWLGTLEFFDGMPTDATASTLLDQLTFLRGVEVFLNTVQVGSLEALRIGLGEIGATEAHQVVISDDLMDSHSLFLTGNTDTVYALGMLDLERDGPTVVEIPPGCGPGTVDDAWFRFVVDMGAPGPDRGQGGKYLIVPQGFEASVPDGYFVAQSTSYSNLICWRGFVVNDSTNAASQKFGSGVKIYPFDRRDAPPPMEYINGSGRSFNTIYANTVEFYEELHRVIDREPVDIIDPRPGASSPASESARAIALSPMSAYEPCWLMPSRSPTPRAARCSSRPMSRTTSCTRPVTKSAASSGGTTGSCWTGRTSATSMLVAPCSPWRR